MTTQQAVESGHVVVSALDASNGGADDNAAQAGHLVTEVPVRDIAHTLTDARGTGDGHGQGWNSNYVVGTLQATSGGHRVGADEAAAGHLVAAFGGGAGGERGADAALTTRTGIAVAYQQHGSNVGPMGTLRRGSGTAAGGVPFVAQAVAENSRDEVRTVCVPQALSMSENQRHELRTSDVSPALSAGGGKPGQGFPAALTFNELGEGHATYQETDTAMSLRTDAGGGGTKANLVATDDDGVVNALKGSDGRRNGCPTGDHTRAVPDGAVVRRLTPTECERLMGWPDGWTELDADGNRIPDGPRYRAIGNGVASPCAEFIGRRLRSLAEG